jgi:hypothetical protein
LHHTVAVALKGGAVVAAGRGIGADREPTLLFAEDSTRMKIERHRLRV